MNNVPTEPGDETRAIDEPASADLTAVEAEADSDSGASAAVDAIDPIGIHGPPRPGQVFFGRYIVERQIGEGGMGTVWLVRHVELDASRALKLIVSGISFDPQMRARFKREARAMARLSHPNAVAVHDARIGRDTAFIEMEYVRGESLNKLIKPGVPMPLDWVARILEQLCDVLQEAHDRKIVHRDLKPSNLMLVADRPPGKELLKVLDFGIAKILEAETEAEQEASDVRTGTGCFLGSAPWSSPEQVSGGLVDGRSDLYSVGIILYELLTGSRPFGGPVVRQIYDHLHTPPPRFAAINPNVAVASAVEQVVLRCLAKDADDRPQTARDLAAEFLWAISDENGTASRGGSIYTPIPPSPSLPVDPARTQAIFGDSDANAAIQVHRDAYQDTDGPFSQPITEPQTAQPAGQLNRQIASDTQVVPELQKPSARDAYGAVFDTSTGTSVAEVPIRPRTLAILVGLAVLAATLFVGIWLTRSPVTSPLAPKATSGPPEGYEAEGKTPHGSPAAAIVRSRDKVRFVRIEGGPFMMGNHGFDPTGKPTDEDQPAHMVTLGSYYLQENEVTNGEMDAYFREHKIGRDERPKRFVEAWDLINDKAGRDPKTFPAVGIGHDLAEKYAAWVKGKLPTEAQWEYAARSRGLEREYVWAGDEKPSHNMANIDSMGDSTYLYTFEVGVSPRDRTEQGIKDMTGNVREWCREPWSRYRESTLSPATPEGPSPSKIKVKPIDFVIRGGSFAMFANTFRTTRPRRADPRDPADLTAPQLAEDGTAADLGFRVVIEWRGK